jgi:hypothetical protein
VETPEEKKPPVLMYALLFLVVWIAVRFLMSLVPWDVRGLSIVADLASVTIAVWLSSRHLATTFSRSLSTAEQLKAVIYCSSWVLLQEAFVLYAFFAEDPPERALSTGGIFFVVTVSIAFYAVLFWVGFGRLSRAFVAANLRGRSGAVA